MGYNQQPYNPALGQPMYQSYNPTVTQPYPYQDRMAGLQQYNQNLQAQFPTMQQTVQQTIPVQMPQMIGRFVNEFTEVTANDVPMDGKCAIFAKNDMSELQARAWQADGTIRTVVFKPVEPVLDTQSNNSTPTQENTLYEAVNSTLAGISDKVDALTSRFEEYIGKPKTTRAKKETETD